jgi:hypothetical protein
LIALVVAAYARAVNNGFVADDFAVFARLNALGRDPYYFFEAVPENFRITSHLIFSGLRAIFGYDSRPFYLFSILLHAFNVLLLRRLLINLACSTSMAFLAAAMFAVFEAPQEAVTWLAAMNETLVGFFLLAALVSWVKRRFALALLAYAVALFSKESAIVFLLIVPIIQLHQGRKAFSREYLLLLVPTMAFAAIFVFTLSKNFFVGQGAYSFGLHSVGVFARSLYRILWPWGYTGVILHRLASKKWPHPEQAARYLGWFAITMLPYVFVTYTNHLASRQVYMSSMVLACMLGAILYQSSQRAQAVFLAGFLSVNTAYLWIRKDAQMEERAAPTTALIEELKEHQPGPLLLLNFPYVQLDIPNALLLTVPGWESEHVDINQRRETCPDCLVLEWDPNRRRYKR